MMPAESRVRLGVNLDHVMTIRQARGTAYPDWQGAIVAAERAGADGITMHLREDRRHIQGCRRISSQAGDTDPYESGDDGPPKRCAILLWDVVPQNCCIVPEKRMELTTEGGLDVMAHQARITELASALRAAGIVVSLFIETG